MDKTTIADSIGQLFTRVWFYLICVFAGLMGKLGIYLFTGKKYTVWQLAGSFLICFFIGFLASFYCYSYCPKYTGYVVPLATYVSDKIALFIFTRDWNTIMELITKKKK